MPLAHDRCICLFKTEYSETSQILTLFSREHGIIRAIAKGAHRRTKAGASRFDGGIDFLDLGSAVFTYDSARDLSTLTEWHLDEGHLGLRKSLRALHLGLYAAELAGRLIEEHDAHQDLFDKLAAVLPQLAAGRREETFLAFALDLLRESGYLPELLGCVSCGATTADWPRAWFSPSRGGIVCRNCEATIPDRRELDIRLLRLLQTLLRVPRLPHLTRHQSDPLNRLLADHVEQTLGGPLRMRRYVLNE
jgi:DNA repair protein RecO (recombination protein O)